MVPTQEPPCKCGRFKALLHCNNGSSLVPARRIWFNIFGSYIRKDKDKDKLLANENCSKILQLKMGNFSPEVTASLFSSSLASFPIQTKTLETMVSSMTLLISFPQVHFIASVTHTHKHILPDPMCPESWHHLEPSPLGSSLLAPLQSRLAQNEHKLWKMQDFLISVDYKLNHSTWKLTRNCPVLLEHAKSLGGWVSILLLSLSEVRYSAFPPRALQKPST